MFVALEQQKRTQKKSEYETEQITEEGTTKKKKIENYKQLLHAKWKKLNPDAERQWETKLKKVAILNETRRAKEREKGERARKKYDFMNKQAEESLRKMSR